MMIARLECDNRNLSLLTTKLISSEIVNSTIKKYSNFTRAYTSNYNQTKNVDYNKMIKQKIDENILATVNTMFQNYIS